MSPWEGFDVYVSCKWQRAKTYVLRFVPPASPRCPAVWHSPDMAARRTSGCGTERKRPGRSGTLSAANSAPSFSGVVAGRWGLVGKENLRTLIAKRPLHDANSGGLGGGSLVGDWPAGRGVASHPVRLVLRDLPHRRAVGSHRWRKASTDSHRCAGCMFSVHYGPFRPRRPEKCAARFPAVYPHRLRALHGRRCLTVFGVVS